LNKLRVAWVCPAAFSRKKKLPEGGEAQREKKDRCCGGCSTGCNQEKINKTRRKNPWREGVGWKEKRVGDKTGKVAEYSSFGNFSPRPRLERDVCQKRRERRGSLAGGGA